MIKSEVIKIKKAENFDNLYIEQELKNLGLDVVRWAVIDIDKKYLTVSVSVYSKNS